MGRQRFNKREHIEKVNKLFEVSHNKTKGLMVEQNQGSWWGDPNAVNPSSNMCVQSVNQPQSYFTGPYPTQSDCEADWVNATQGNTITPCYDCVNNTPTIVEEIGPNSPWCQNVPGGPQCGTDCTLIPMNAIGGTPNFPLVNDPNLACGGAGQGDWWCPTGVAGPGPCIQSPTNPQPGYATGPYPTQTACDSQCGGGNPGATCMSISTVVCDDPTSTATWPCVTLNGNLPDTANDMGSVIDVGNTYGSTGQPIFYEITAIDPSTTSPYGVQDFPVIPGGCPGTNNNPSAGCDFSWSSPCAQQHLNTGGQNSWQNMLAQRESGYNANGCQHFQAMVNWVTDQLNSGVAGNGSPLTQVQINRKTEQLEWAQCQANSCGCPNLNMPPLTGGPTPPPPSDPDLIDPEPPKKLSKPKKEKLKERRSINEELKRMKQMWKHKL
jgi:hypothetical protein